MDGRQLDRVSDGVDEVNVFLGTNPNLPRPQEKDDGWRDGGSQFDQQKDKSTFRNYERAVDRVKAFYREQHTNQCVLRSQFRNFILR